MVEEKNEERKKHPGGRPLKFKTPEELEQKIQAYFDFCDSKNADADKIVKPYTISGLCVYLDISRQALDEYDDREGYGDAIKKAKQRIESFVEEGSITGRLNPVVSIFNLKNNFGWRDKQEVEQTGEITITISDQAQKWGK